jgi:hypothetical protein
LKKEGELMLPPRIFKVRLAIPHPFNQTDTQAAPVAHPTKLALSNTQAKRLEGEGTHANCEADYNRSSSVHVPVRVSGNASPGNRSDHSRSTEAQ